MNRIDDPSVRIAYLRRAGMPESVIVSRLVLEGWAMEDLAPHFAPAAEPIAYEHEPEPVRTAPQPVQRVAVQKTVRRFPLAVSTTLLSAAAIVALGFAGFTLYKPPVVYSISLPGSGAATTTLVYGALAALADPGYYEEVKGKLAEDRRSFIDADLSTMRLKVYSEGTLALEVPILAKGRAGSWWETPAGIYKIESMTKSGWSTFGQVHMPYSMQFQGNFFIHGWPYYEDGTPVATSYSGGCVRLSTEDAKKVYDLAQVGMPVIVYNEKKEGDTFNYQLKAPPIDAAAYLVADAENGTVLTSKNAAVAAPIASISKLVAALVATEYVNLDKNLVVPESAIVYTSVPRLRAGTSVRAYDLLFLLLQESSNEAAEVFAAASGRAQFVKRMNDKAGAINLHHTVFSDPSGAKGDYSTPQDLFTLLRYILDNRRFIFGITAGDIKDSAYGKPEFTNIRNFNIIKNTSAKLVGGKVGQTREASETYAGIFDANVGGEKRQIAVIVLGSHDSTGDVAKLLSFVQTLYAPGEAQATNP